MRRLGAVLFVGVLAAGAAGCAADESEADRVAYTVAPSAEAPPPDAGDRAPVETTGEVCVSSGGPSTGVPVPSSWHVEQNSVDGCGWSGDDGTLTLTYGEISNDDDKVWRSVLDQHRAAFRKGTIAGYAFIRYTADEGGGPLWHYRYVAAQADGGVYYDSLNLYRDGWQITYDAKSAEYNNYYAEQLIRHADVF